MVSASLAICIFLAAAGGIFNVIAVAFLAYPRAQKKVGNEWSKCSLRKALALNIMFQLLNAAASVSSSWFGPVSISVPTSHGTNMLFNMIMFGLVLRLEDIDKDMIVGSFVAAVAVILLPVVGPGAQDYQELSILLLKPYSLLWSVILFLGMVVSTIGLAYSTKAKQPQSYLFYFNLVTQCTSGVLATTFAKMLDLVDGASLGITIFLCLFSSVILLSAIVQQAKLQQSVFIPLKTAVTIIVNSMTGIIIWEDWRVVSSWVGYGCALALLILANYLISNVDVFNAKTVQKCLRDGGVLIEINDSGENLVASDKVFDAEATQETTIMDRDDSIDSEEDSDESVEIIDGIIKKGDLSDDIEALEDFIHSRDVNSDVKVLDDFVEHHESIRTIQIDANIQMEERCILDLEEEPANTVGISVSVGAEEEVRLGVDKDVTADADIEADARVVDLQRIPVADGSIQSYI